MEFTSGMVPVECGSCGGRVLVAKHSAQHTSVQWDLAAAAACPEFADRPGCPRLRTAIARAVADGSLELAS